jgi:hypothetical protein
VSIDRAAMFGVLRSLRFGGRWVVAGSGPMLALGLVDSISDIDIVGDAQTWGTAISISRQSPRSGMFGDRVVGLDANGVSVEVFDGWLGTTCEVIFVEATEIEGYLFSPIERVLESKRKLLRRKDLAHIDILEARLAEGPTANSH